MSFAAPWMLAAGIAAALGVVALHLLSTRRPPAALLPTVRFVPESDVRAVARTSKPTDLLLLALRALAVLLIAAGFAQPTPDAPGPRIRSVVALEWTTALTDIEAARRTARERLAEGDALVLFDTAARVLDAAALDDLAAPTVRRAALSPMYVAAGDAAQRIARGADSLRLVVIAAYSSDALDAATPVLRASWPGRVERVLISAAADTTSAQPVQLLPADASDPLAPALRALRAARGAHRVRVQRAEITAADSAWLNATVGALLIHWPRRLNDSLRADGLASAEGSALVAPLARDEVIQSSGSGASVVARWRDGAPAVVESTIGQSCLRRVNIGLPETGDLTLRSPFGHFLARLVVPCGGARETALPDSLLASASDAGPLATASSLLGASSARSALTPWLLALGLLVLIAEQIVRRRQRETVS